MTTTIPSPDPLPMPAPAWLLWGLLMLTFVLHVMLMNFVLGASLMTVAARIRGGKHASRMAHAFGKAMPTVFAGAITFGVAPLLFLQALYGRLFFSSAILMGWFWLSIVPLVILAYYGVYLLSFRGDRLGRAGGAVAAIVALLLLGVAFIQTNNMTLMLRPDRFLTLYRDNAHGVQLNLSDPTFLPRYLHMILGAAAVAGIVLALYGAAMRRRDQQHGRWAIRQGSLWFAVPTAINVATGIWWAGAMPGPVLQRFMGASAFATSALAAGIFCGFVALGLMLRAADADRPGRTVVAATAAVVLTLIAMLFARDEVRQGMLLRAGFQPVTWVAPQWGVIAIFGVLLIAAIGTTVWMLLLLRKPAAGTGVMFEPQPLTRR